jgi:DNA-binding CsgD family transcriptional regulator
VEHFQLLAFVFALATGFAGITTTAILRSRLRDPTLTVMLVVISTFSAGLLFNIVVFYLSRIAGVSVEAPRAIAALNLLLVIVMYGGIASIVLRAHREGRIWPIFALAVPVVAAYLLFGIVQPPTLLGRLGSSGARVVSVVSASLFLGYSGARMVIGGSKTSDASIRFLLRSIGFMLTAFAVLSVILSIAVRSSNPPITTILNYFLYVAWNVVAIVNFVRYLSAPSDVFAEEGVPESAIRRYGITAREREVIILISRGFSNKEIAEKLGVSFTTARTHVYNVFKKTGAASRVELLRILSAG